MKLCVNGGRAGRYLVVGGPRSKARPSLALDIEVGVSMVSMSSRRWVQFVLIEVGVSRDLGSFEVAYHCAQAGAPLQQLARLYILHK